MNLRSLVLGAALALFVPAAFAGEACEDCQNCCPLAKQANQRRSTGGEAVLASKVVQKEEIARVVRNLARV
jgi:hypothetical protein